MQRRTYALIDGNVLENNVKEIISRYPNYKYYFGVVKNNAYHHGIRIVKDLIKGGVNYLCVSSLEEALQVRKYDSRIPVLILEPISLDLIDDAINNKFTITIDSIDYVNKLLEHDLFNTLKIHLAVDSGMHRIGYTKAKELSDSYKLLSENKNILVEGVYTHFGTNGITDPYYNNQIKRFLDITSGIDLKSIPIVHLNRSMTLVKHPKLEIENGVRLGIIMYGFSQSTKLQGGIKGFINKFKLERKQKKYNITNIILENDLKLNTAFSLYSEVISVRKVNKDELVGYGINKLMEDGYIATLPIGYADGVDKSFKYVYLNNKKCKIVGDSMDMLMVFSIDKPSIGDKVEIFGDNISINEVKNNTHLSSYHIFNNISNRVLRIHKNGDKKEEINY